ncbi:MAG TPA: NAD(P)/FAD-dependent oxidoreductase [Frankiaceae bacterium]|jgi:cation diffusion facilitator CzcD-associated flavoprotein CzcO|nr:NAD(P)/FAD-dependent oxidoreductase [Frankiaceae bacterium]
MLHAIEESVDSPADAAELPSDVRIAVIGAGFGGLGTAIRLKQSGIDDFVVLERGDDIGGTWRDNSYPGCACDVPSHLYSYSFAPNPDWSRAFSSQPEIQAYLQRCAQEFDVRRHVYLHAAVTEARWDESLGHWKLVTARGELTARVLVAAQGPLSDPSLPAVKGLSTFGGATFHSATWDHDVDLTGKRVAVVGTGASAIQFIPYVQKIAAKLTVFQRTAPWVMPRRDRAINGWEKALYRRVPAAQRALRAGIYWTRELMVPALTGNDRLLSLGEKQGRKFLRKQVADPVLRENVTPHFRLGCKRVLLSNDYYPALSQPNAGVVTDTIAEVVPEGIVTLGPKGERLTHPVDAIIFGTGFHVTDVPLAAKLIGKDGRTLREHWDEAGMSALHGATVSGFPNLFLLVGPNTGLGHNSIIFMIESQLTYLLGALRAMEQTRATTFEPRPAVQQAYNAQIQEQLRGTVWSNGGCASWYLDDQGRNTTLWPTFTFRFRQLVRRFNAADYEFGPAAADGEGLGSPVVQSPVEVPVSS